MPESSNISGTTITYPAGAAPAQTSPGDFILTHRNEVYSKLITLGQKLRFPKDYAHWSHAAILVGGDGQLVEARGRGVQASHLSYYLHTDYVYVHIDADSRDRQQMSHFALRCCGEDYSWLTIVSLVFTLLCGARFNLGTDAHTICSGLVARAHERGDAIFDREPQRIMPADLARYYSV